MSSREDDAPNVLAPKLRLGLGGLPRSPAPTHNWPRSIANSRLSRCILVQVPPSGLQRELVVAVGLLPPPQLARLLLLVVSL